MTAPAREGGAAARSTRKPRRGDRLEVAVESFDAEGFGVGESDGLRVRMRYAVPGSRVRADVGSRRGRRVEARVEAVLEPGPHTRQPRCEHFGTCGGCAFQSTAYERQLAELRALIRRALEANGISARVEAVIGCDDPWHYRNKMDFTFSNRRWIEDIGADGAGQDTSFALGLHVPRRHDKVLDVARCAIHFEQADALLASVRELTRRRGLPPWDVRTHTGLLRHLVLRKGVRSGEIMVDLVTSRDAPDSIEPLCAELCERHPEVTTFVQNINTRAASVAVGERELVLRGEGVIREHVLGLTYTISANSFFQTNTAQAERLFEIVREEARCGAEEVVYDLYCGAGSIALTLARDAREVWGFEIVESAVSDARQNAAGNGVKNVHFECADVLGALRGPDPRPWPAPDVCVVDPPRAGLHPKLLGVFGDLAPRRLVYVSCNVRATARELPVLLRAGYRIDRVRPIDLFPHTPHVECVFSLERNE